MVGLEDGESEGVIVGLEDGASDGDLDGDSDGELDGEPDGESVGPQFSALFLSAVWQCCRRRGPARPEREHRHQSTILTQP